MTLDQRSGIVARQRLTILEDKVVIRATSIGRSTENALQFTEIAPNPTRIHQIAWAWFAFAALAVAAAVLFLWLGLHAGRRDADAFYVMMVVCAIPFALALYGGIRRTLDVIVFPTARGNLVIRNGRPTPDACREFVQALQQRVTDSRNIEKRIVRTVLNVLRQEDFLDEWKYQRARERFEVTENV